MEKLGLIDVLRQLKDDLIGKDSYRGVSLSYAWLANQLGHFTLGYFLAMVLFELGCTKTYASAAMWSAIIWFGFEMYNFIGPLLFKKDSAKVKLNLEKSYTFAPAWWHVFYDTFTDVCFFWIGAMAYVSHWDETFAFGWIYWILGTYLFIAWVYWYPSKIYLQQARFPWQSRLSQWKHLLTDSQKQSILDFVNNQTSKVHLIIQGPANKGKTTLAIGMATERALKWHTCAYVTFARFLSDIKHYQNPIPGPSFWDWKSADTLIIDDINPSDPMAYEFMSIAQIEKEWAQVLDLLRQKNCIFVVGSARVEPWQQLLAVMPAEDRALFTISLNTSK